MNRWDSAVLIYDTVGLGIHNKRGSIQTSITLDDNAPRFGDVITHASPFES